MIYNLTTIFRHTHSHSGAPIIHGEMEKKGDWGGCGGENMHAAIGFNAGRFIKPVAMNISLHTINIILSFICDRIAFEKFYSFLFGLSCSNQLDY